LGILTSDFTSRRVLAIMAEDKSMPPVSGDEVETDGVYENEWGAEELLKRGETFPADVMLGNTEWTLTGLVPEDRERQFYKDKTTHNRPRVQIRRGQR
jgi:hypothetical protein